MPGGGGGTTGEPVCPKPGIKVCGWWTRTGGEGPRGGILFQLAEFL